MSDETVPEAPAQTMDTPGGGAPASGDRTEDGEPKTPYRWRRRLARIRRFLRRSFWSILLFVVAVIALASQTGRGQELVLRAALSEIRSALAGELRIEGIRSGTLLTGATLRGVSLEAADGRPFLVADSVVLRYSLLSALTGGPPIRSTTVWGADILVSRYDEGQPVNVSLLLAEGDSASSSRGREPTRLGHIAIRDGRARIRTPAAGSGAEARARGPEGRPVDELAFEGLDLDVENAVVLSGDSVDFRADLASFSSEIGIRSEPIRVREVFGSLSYGDRGIVISDAAFRLPGTLLEGALRVGPEEPGDPWTFWTRLESRGWGDLSDVAWVDERIPEGRFRGGAEIDVDDRVAILLDGMEVELEASEVVFDGRAVFADEMILDAMEVSASPVTLERLEPWLGREIPLDGWLSGDGVFSGTLDDLTASGRMTLVPTGFGGSPTSAEFDGRVLRQGRGGARDLTVRLVPLNYTVLEAFWPQIPWAGTGTARVELDGDVRQGMRIFADLQHDDAAGGSSRIEADGILRRDVEEEAWITDVALELRPLSMSVFASLAPELELDGVVSGSAQLAGALEDLSVSGELSTDFGRVAVDSRVNLRAPASAYRLSVSADSVPLSRFSERIPERTHWSGRLTLEGSGFSLDSADVAVSVDAGRSRVGPVRVDTVAARARIRSGLLVTESLAATVGGIDLSGRGQLGLRPGRWGSSSLEFSATTLEGLRPLLMGVGDSVLVRDELSALDRELLRVQGIEPDTLPTRRDVRFDGQVTGSASLTGDVTDMDLGVIVEIVEGAYRQDQVDSARVAFTAAGLPSLDGSWEMGASATGIVFQDRSFVRGGFEAQMSGRAGEGRIQVVRRAGEEYRAQGAFAVDSLGGTVDLDAASIRVDEQLWQMTHAGPIRWSGTRLSVDSLEVVRLGDDPMHLMVDGDLSRAGESDFRVVAEGLHLERALHVAQLDRLEIGGHVDADLSVRGTAEAPIIDGVFSSLGPRYGALQLTRLDGSIRYADRSATVEVQGWDRDRRVVTGSGTLPVDLGLVDVERRVLDAPMDVELATDSLDAAIALSYLSSLDGVLGSISGEVRIGGTPRQPEPEGTITLRDAAWSIEAIGVRHRGVSGQLVLNPDRTVDVNLMARAPGRSNVTGTVTLEPIGDPSLDLDFEFARFLAVSRADIEGWVSGGFTLGGTYTRPVAEGALRLDEATVFVDELQRAASVVDLSDPFLFDASLAVDTTALVSQPLFAGLRNPFFDNLRVDVDLSVPRGAWLRSIDTNVEMSGELLVVYDRSAGDFVLIGELQALRGSHRVLGRTFGLDGGTVSFIGRPGLNPDLDIQASTRIRAPDEDPIVVNAEVTGTLVQPVVTLTSEEAGLAEEDLISYIVFGQPSGALGGRNAGGGRLRELNAVSSVFRGGVTFIGGQLANQLGSAIAREFTLDYLSFQQGGVQRTIDGTFVADAQVEVGRYLGDRVFVVMVLRPFDPGPQDKNNVAGLRVEVALTDDYNVELFREDRFLRSGSAGLRSSSSLIGDESILGVFLFREWGYGSTPDP
ncbi:MAG: translocation/assembly module TamB domain-containing protein [Longimicrobiales bacterium]|nr:translocation/assembly module TamB domain-containing protein [Longimicrobiales bacterium]